MAKYDYHGPTGRPLRLQASGDIQSVLDAAEAKGRVETCSVQVYP